MHAFDDDSIYAVIGLIGLIVFTQAYIHTFPEDICNLKNNGYCLTLTLTQFLTPT